MRPVVMTCGAAFEPHRNPIISAIDLITALLCCFFNLASDNKVTLLHSYNLNGTN